MHPSWIRRSYLRRIVVSLAGVACVCLTVGGCGDSGPKPPPLGNVKGKVTLDGQPVKNASVNFYPDNTRQSSARTDEQGNYELMFNDKLKGAAVGTHLVKISARDAQPEKGNMETIPAKYNDKSELKKDVKAGDNTIDFDLKSK